MYTVMYIIINTNNNNNNNNNNNMRMHRLWKCSAVFNEMVSQLLSINTDSGFAGLIACF